MLSPQKVPLPVSTPRTMAASWVRQEVSLENISIKTPSWNCCCCCCVTTSVHTLRKTTMLPAGTTSRKIQTSKSMEGRWRLLKNGDTDRRERGVKPVSHWVKHVNALKCNTTSHGELQIMTEGHTVTCALFLNRQQPSVVLILHLVLLLENQRLKPRTFSCF